VYFHLNSFIFIIAIISSDCLACTFRWTTPHVDTHITMGYVYVWVTWKKPVHCIATSVSENNYGSKIKEVTLINCRCLHFAGSLPLLCALCPPGKKNNFAPCSSSLKVCLLWYSFHFESWALLYRINKFWESLICPTVNNLNFFTHNLWRRHRCHPLSPIPNSLYSDAEISNCNTLRIIW
jgi:hypothetical protein